jgi:hypothetical protein
MAAGRITASSRCQSRHRAFAVVSNVRSTLRATVGVGHAPNTSAVAARGRQRMTEVLPDLSHAHSEGMRVVLRSCIGTAWPLLSNISPSSSSSHCQVQTVIYPPRRWCRTIKMAADRPFVVPNSDRQKRAEYRCKCGEIGNLPSALSHRDPPAHDLR